MSDVAQRLRAALELHDTGVRLMRQNLRRRHRGASEEQIERLLAQWLRTRPGAEHGDGRALTANLADLRRSVE